MKLKFDHKQRSDGRRRIDGLINVATFGRHPIISMLFLQWIWFAMLLEDFSVSFSCWFWDVEKN
jgi:hypothetical protein